MKSAIVTGSSRGIGRAVAEALLKRGINVCISSSSARDAQAVAAELQGRGAKVIGVGCDVTDAQAVQNLWDQAEAAFGKVDIWINNAGLALGGATLEAQSHADLRRMVDINIMGVINGCKTAIDGFRKNGGGALYNMLGAGADGNVVPGMTGYASTKAFVTFMSRSLAQEMAGSGIVVGALSPGLVITEGFMREAAKMKSLPPEVVAAREKHVNLIADHPETTGRWVAKIVDTNQEQGRIFTWLTPRKIRDRAKRKPRDILSRYRDRMR